MTERTRILLALLWVPCGALAQPHASDEARRHFESGQHAFDTGDYARAADEFQAAYDLTHHPDVLFNVYSAAERDGQLQRAADALQSYLRDGQVEAERRPALEERLTRLEERIAATPEPTPPQTPVPAPPPPPEPVVTGPSWIAIGTLIGSGVLLASFGVFAALSTAEHDSLANGCGRFRACTSGELGGLTAYNTVADISWIAGAAAGLAGLVLLFALPPERAMPVAVAPWVAPSAGGLSIGGSL